MDRFRRGLVVAALLYLIVLLLLVSSRPLWLDEVIQLQGTSGTDFDGLMRHVKANAGGAPFGYMTQQWSVSLLGAGAWGARLPSVVAAVGCFVMLLLLCRKLAARGVAIVAGLWIVTPLVLRYALEGRPYMQAMFFAVLAAWIIVKLRETGSAAWAAALALTLAAVVYSQPYAVFGPAGFAVGTAWQHRDKRFLALAGAAFAAAGISFLPWLAMARGQWAHAGFAWSWALGLVLLREFAGAGYFASIPLLALATYGVWRRGCSAVAPWLGAVVASLGFALLANAAFNYFFAIRQVIYVLPFLFPLAAEGAVALWAGRWQCLALTLLLVFAGASSTKSYRYLTDRNEDWGRLSNAVADSARDGCVALPPGDTAGFYALFRPEIALRLCADAFADRVAMPLHTYTDRAAADALRERLRAMGLRGVATEAAGFGQVERFERR